MTLIIIIPLPFLTLPPLPLSGPFLSRTSEIRGRGEGGGGGGGVLPSGSWHLRSSIQVLWEMLECGSLCIPRASFESLGFHVCLSVLSRIYVCLSCLENMSVLSRICLSVLSALSRLCLSVLFCLESVSRCHVLSVCLVLSRVCVYLV